MYMCKLKLIFIIYICYIHLRQNACRKIISEMLVFTTILNRDFIEDLYGD